MHELIYAIAYSFDMLTFKVGLHPLKLLNKCDQRMIQFVCLNKNRDNCSRDFYFHFLQLCLMLE